MGPPAPGQCVIGSAGCGGAAGAAAVTESAMNDMAVADQKKMEQTMRANGTYTALEQTKDGAIFQLSDGRWSRSDYVQGMCYMPMTLDRLLADPNLPASLREAALKAQKELAAKADKDAQAKKDKDQLCGSLNAGSDPACKKDKKPGFRMNARTNEGPTLTAAAAPDETPDPTEAGANDTPDFKGLGEDIASPPGDAPNVAQGGPSAPRQDPSFTRESGKTIADFNNDLTSKIQSGGLGTLDPESLGFRKNREAAEKMNKAIQAGTKALDNDPAKRGGDNTTRSGGTRFFGN